MPVAEPGAVSTPQQLSAEGRAARGEDDAFKRLGPQAARRQREAEAADRAGQ